MKTIRGSAALLMIAAAMGSAACSAGAEDAARERVGRATRPIISGSPSSADQDAVVLIAILENGDIGGTCTGTMVAPNLVLTALHCVAETDEGALCAADGTAVQGGAVRAARSPSDFAIVAGADVSGDVARSRVAGVRKVVTTGASTLCNSDLALLVLDRAMPNAKIAPLRLDGAVRAGDKVTSIGWGLTEQGSMPSQRMMRSGVDVIGVGPMPGAGPAEFVVGEAVCSGDSGGPAIASTGAVVGVVSRGGNGKPADPQTPASTCIGAQSVYSSLAPHKATILAAFDDAGAKPVLEKSGGAAAPASPGSSDGDDGGGAAPEDPAAADGETPAPTATTTTTTRSGCSAAPSSSWTREGAFALVLAAALAAARRGRAT